MLVTPRRPGQLPIVLLVSITGILIVLLVLVSGVRATWAQSPLGAEKRLLYWSWEHLHPDFASGHQQILEKLPFDGYVVEMKAGTQIFVQKLVVEAEVDNEAKVLAGIRWSRRMDNFLFVNATADKAWDWFNDDHWRAAEQNTRTFARVVHKAKVRGICFDPEPYGPNPWKYPAQPSSQKKSFADVSAKVRERGRQFAAVVEAEAPAAIIFTFMGLSILDDIARLPSPTRAAELTKTDYGLWVAFIEGILEGSQLRVIDGNEWGFYNENGERFFRDAHGVRSRETDLIRPSLRLAYRSRVEIAQPVYLDFVLALGEFGQTPPPKSAAIRFPTRKLTRAERLRYLQHNVYYALYTSDEYAWVYAETLQLLKDNPDPEVVAAIEAARNLVRNDYPLPFTVDGFIERAKRPQARQPTR
jgi:hypothetical protein